MKLFPLTGALVAVLACGMTPAQAAPPKDVPPGHWAAGPVNRMVGKKIMQNASPGKFDGNKPVTRYELAVTLDRFVRYIEAGRKPLNPTPRRAGAVLPKNVRPEVKQALTHLTAYGFLPANSPLVTKDGSKPATAQELADALAQVTIRLSDRSLPPQKD